jgi:hypothetical protein
MKNLLLIAAAAATLAPFASQAESNFVTTTGSTTPAVNAKLDFKIVVPKVLFLQVGTGTSMADNGNVDKVTFTVPASGIGNGTAVAGTGGDLTGGAVTVRVLGNTGDVTLTNTTAGQLSNGVALNPTVPWTDITVTPGALSSTTTGYTNAAIAHPPFNNGATGGVSATATTLAASAGLVRREGSWTFAYANNTVMPAGTYGDSVANKGQVTYTATAP